MMLTKLERSLCNVNPSLISKKIKTLIFEHIQNKEVNDFSEENITELEKLLLDNPSKNFLDFVWDNGFSNYFLRSSKRVLENDYIIMYALNRDPNLLNFLVRNEVTPKIVEKYEQYLKENPLETYDFRNDIPGWVIENEFILNRILENLILEVEKGSVSELTILKFQVLMNAISDKEEYINRMVPYIKDLGLLEKINFRNFSEQLFSNSNFIREAILANCNLDYVSLANREKVNLVLADIIRSSNFDVSEYLKTFSSKDIVYAIMQKEDISNYNFRYMKIEDFNAEQIVRIINELGTYFAPINYVSRADVLKVFIDDGDYRFLTEFRKEAYDEENLISLLDVLETLEENQVKVFIDYIGNNDFLISKLLEKIKDNILMRKFDFSLIRNFNRLGVNNLKFEHFDTINEIFLSGEFGKKWLESITNLFESSVFLNYILSNDLYNYYSEHISIRAFDENNFYEAYKKYGLKSVLKKVNDPSIISTFISSFPFENAEEIEKYFEELNNIYSPSLALFFISNAKKSGFQSEKITSYIQYYEDRIFNELTQLYQEEELVKMFVSKVNLGERNPFTLDFIKDIKGLKVAAYFSDINGYIEAERLSEIPQYFIDKVNKKHIQQIISMLKEKGCSGIELTLLSMKMLSNIELQRCRDLLNSDQNKNYGKIELHQLKSLFGMFSLYDTEFKQEGNYFVPVYNEDLIRIFFGENYKIKNTPIRNFLGSFEEKKEEYLRLEELIVKNRDLPQEEKMARIEELTNSFRDYQFSVSNFVQKRNLYHSRWFSIKEEFLRQQNKSKLKLKLNLQKIDEIFKIIAQKTPELDVRDTPLLNSDVFDYVGVNTQHTSHPETARKRAVELSRRMEYRTHKKFPSVVTRKGGLTLRVYDPQDRRILSAGFKSDCCFRPNGAADNDGKDNSLLNYCVSTEYGGGLEIVDESGKLIMFSPLLRNGNVLMIHSIETTFDKDPEMMRIVHELLKEYSENSLEIAKENGDELDFVTITNFHHLNPKFTEGYLPKNAEFRIFDEEHKFDDMYNNLNSGHAILAHREGKTFSDIKYGEVKISYDYDSSIIKQVNHVEFTADEIVDINLMNKLKDEIISLSNERYLARKNNDSSLNLSLLTLINGKKAEYLSLYKKLLESRRGLDLFSEYSRIQRLINYVDDNTHVESKFDIGSVMYGNGWYINLSSDWILTYNALPNATQEMLERLEMLKQLNGYSKYVHTVNMQEENSGLSI